ncbi:FkbM family methyltransferase [Nisaea sediminum]|uniref:FkbM family methyltransferase n=1 Tax=Nisaea sediminum TaxID=2775867 RepID=UPI001865D967|nr:FkbM family methyltransferase [Nisaea sediminum]
MSQERMSLTEMLGIDTTINIVDVGANPHAGSGLPPYDALLKRGKVHLVGFEPNPEALAVLQSQKGPNETYLPHAVYDGSVQTLRLCQAPGMTSLLEPNMAVLGAFHGFDQWGKVIAREQIETVRLDDVAEISDLDFLKIDIQGGELEVFRNGTRKLADCLVIQSEVEFLEMYEGQPLFTDVDLFLRERGFVLHRFVEPTSRTIKPLIVNNDPYAGLSQLMWADAVFVRDFTRFGELAPGKLLKLALILHDVFSSFDLALRALLVRDAMVGERLGQTYLQKLQIA